MFQSNYRQQNTSTTGPRPKNTLKFDNDYDFEEANTHFEELRSQFVKLKVEDKAPVVSIKSSLFNPYVIQNNIYM